jgi:hypothetical protein
MTSMNQGSPDGFGGQPGSGAQPGYGAQPGAGMTPEQIAYQRGRQDTLRQVRQLSRPRMTVFRVICGVVWGFFTIGFTVGGIGLLAGGSPGSGILCLVLAVLAGWYDYRIWTLKARRLWLIL